MKVHRQSGFSLLEMALSLAVLGFLFAMVPMALSVLGSAQSASPSLDRKKLAVNSAVGFIVQHDRLPCPDANGDGYEDCNGSRSGRFPWRTAGLGQQLVNDRGFPFQYAVYQHANANLVALQSSYQPSLLSGATPLQSNALDFCQGLRLGVSGGLQPGEASVQAHTGSARVNPAFLFVDPGPLDADRDGRPFDGINAKGLVFESTGHSQSDDYDDQVTAMSFAELAVRLDCPSILARVSAATRDSNAAYDARRAFKFYLDFRKFGVEVRETNLEIAELKREIAEFNTAASAAMALNDAAAALSSATGAIAIGVAAINAAAAIYAIQDELSSTAEDVSDKKDQLAIAKQQHEAAKVAHADALAYQQLARTTALNRDAKGWFQ
ncbi:type II secretion system protein [Stutzerimonas stutzeri]|uniref:type II secretion system protein n=1 Tax=Stutzerimonas stutzeri TaxID=316 RepID=UPI00210E6AD0|nr:type II secretion system protein [Stutzerimonas stutzeri]MCQ4241642.1 type II secretion system GspH family protein [Stutzerimonas stutzeri]